MQQAIDTYILVKHAGTNNSAKCNHWYPDAVKHVVARKRCENPDDSKILGAYHKANRTYREEVCMFEIKREQWIIDGDNAGSFFRFVNSKLSWKRGPGALNNDASDI